MANNDRAEALANPASLRTKQLLDLLDTLGPESPELAALDTEAVAANIDPNTLGKGDLTRLLLAIDRLSSGGGNVDVTQVQPATFARLIGRASKGQLADVLGKPRLRTVILDEIFRRMGEHLRADRAADTRAVVHWRFTGGSGEGGYDRYETVIENGSCAVRKCPNTQGRGATPRVSITLAPADFLQLITGKASAPLLFVTGKLKVKGDLAFAAGMMGLFDLPKAD
ncbi:SCP2 sterol-binding domain-containing protein [Sciscionella marina]|uniref:SCP2 sterol-binding domain-containing protein n=1 Tax=Sciscionella marina TaxID=508770 RepID=UPI0003753BEB|nr:SCP2 sterol-binding domain-containing protein [Sciscionella marina]